ncbi:DNA recombination protein RmuC [Thalassotalea ponticola]|uniref:DNA recombination protein RmuC n=1 Tax=Thalassotalea ponticola TaxID=1523392 RepID=UPI0025B29E46|nr:DNA recombination protein RmuC [Thalassotalea ponticola]MDN3651281.1 DNA recombination protein RmuC [Thalassotalea ponticola]
MSLDNPLLLPIVVATLILLLIGLTLFVINQLKQLKTQAQHDSRDNAVMAEKIAHIDKISQQQSQLQNNFINATQQQLAQLRLSLTEQLAEHKQQFNKNQIEAINQLVGHLQSTTAQNREELSRAMQANGEVLAKRMNELTQNTDKRLQEISAGVEKRLSEGFDKTTKTFNDIVKRLAIIDDAQRKITELSSNVVSLQEVLSDKRSRGAFGEVQLNALIRNVLPEKHFALQYTLSNAKIADCILFLPQPTGNIVIDSKFPLESYRKMTEVGISDVERKNYQNQFKQDIKKHINDISSKYILDKETADGAIMFLPAEAIFAEIHAHFPELVELAYRSRVWLTSPTTLMAVLTTVRSVLKDEATRQQVHIIQEHLHMLGTDFNRFKERFDHLARHIDQAANDVKKIHTSANKISSRFEKIEQVDLSQGDDDTKPARVFEQTLVR